MNVSEEGCNCRLAFPLYKYHFLFKQLPTSPACSINMWLYPHPIICLEDFSISERLFLFPSFHSGCSGMQDTKSIEKWDSSGGGKKIPLLFMKEGSRWGRREEALEGKGGMVNTPRQSHVRHLCSLKGGSHTMPVQTKGRLKKRRREWGNKCKTAGVKELQQFWSA